VQEILRKVLDQKNHVYNLGVQVQAREKEIDSITRDQSRLRENMKALKGSAEEKTLLERYTKQLQSQEDRLDALNQQVADLKQKQEAAENELNRMVQDITLDQSL
jgi:cell division protein FtsB